MDLADRVDVRGLFASVDARCLSEHQIVGNAYSAFYQWTTSSDVVQGSIYTQRYLD